jgi:ribosomal protein L16/L10AE
MIKKKRKILNVSQKLKFKRYRKIFCYPRYNLISYKTYDHIKKHRELSLILNDSVVLQKYHFDTTKIFFGKLFKILRYGRSLRHPYVWGKSHCPAYLRVPITQKPLQVRMGKGKGPVVYWAAPINVGRLFFQPVGMFLAPIYESLIKASKKLPVHSTILSRSQRVLNLLKKRSFRLLKKKQKNYFAMISRKKKILAEVRNYNKYGVEVIRRRTKINKTLKRFFKKYKWTRLQFRRRKKLSLLRIYAKRLLKPFFFKQVFHTVEDRRVLSYAQFWHSLSIKASTVQEKRSLFRFRRQFNKYLLNFKKCTHENIRRKKKVLSLKQFVKKRRKLRFLFSKRCRKLRTRYVIVSKTSNQIKVFLNA